MKAFAVELPPGTILIRVGPDTDSWGKPFDYALPMLPDGTLTGLMKNPGEDVGKFTAHHMRALKDLVEGELGREWHWDRLNHDNHRTVRRRTMAAEKKAQGFEVTFSIERDGNKYATYQYHNMSKKTMQSMQGAIAAALLALGNEEAGVE